MQEILDIVVAFLRAVLRFKWVVILVACFLSTFGWAFVYQLEDQYQAKARIFVDTNRILQPLLKGIAIQPDVNRRVQLMSRMLLSRPNLEKLAEMTDLDVKAVTDFDRETLLTQLGRQVRLSGVRNNASLYNVTYSSSDPVLAKRMVQAVITVFIETTMGDERKDSESAQEFLDQQIALYETRLTEAERRLSSFKRDNSGRMPGESGGYYQRLDLARSRESAARLELLETVNRRDDLQKQLAREPATLSAGGLVGFSPTETEIARQNNELATLLVRYTERHPRIAQLRDSIAALEERKLLAASGASDASFNRVSNPVHEEIRKQLSETTARVAELEVRVSEFGRQTRELNDTVDSIPKVEAELAQLDRDYNIVKEQYETVLERRESARLSEQVEQNADDVQFRVIDPPFVPSKPSGPNKRLLSAMSLAAALGVGAALAFGLSWLNPVFYTASNVASQTSRSILGSVSMLKTKSERLGNVVSWAGFILVSGLLLAVFGLLIAYYQGWFANGQLDFLTTGTVGHYIKLVFDALFSLIEEFKSLVPGFED